ncbi:MULTISPECIES: hypothetical protein [Brevibacillus]|jgi:hypothetical protein|uniref:Uncharacterized protein n=1 Tax=Brevibacillus borstelensis AK1 TaxID=1300222 RepID=M8D6U8_9BACL|nr:hypothetical protein [Brevibacillus borstelensis]EMT51979.1 hypothetical protein I532_14088 [Brevibacillus borstelensis AK1]MBE5394181.1 hypothetical protein [Brevibacillus borstelensis]MCC0565554.1 hypothetical protein [Brevibacillus borstelensis]MCM3468867.1 hypothetical protein [Brevibacillus borstelensis]MCM3559746.1 hypothetical protein [Brevibacillus borstelensis]
MLRKIFGTLPPYLTFFGAVLSILIPWLFYKASQKLHQYGDPPWKNGSTGQKGE